MFFNKCVYRLTLFFGLLLGQNINAMTGPWGAGVYSGQPACPYESKTSKSAVDVSDEEKEERKKIANAKAEIKNKQDENKLASKRMENLEKKIERYFDSEVVEFLLKTHIENSMKCDDYTTAHPSCSAAQPVTQSVDQPADQATTVSKTVSNVDCGKLNDEVPKLLAEKWTSKDKSKKGGYCIGDSDKNGGSVHSSICNDNDLRPDPKKKKYNTSSCAKDLAEYRKRRIERDSAASKVEDFESELEDSKFAIEDIQREKRLRKTESDCEQCDNASRGYSYEEPKRNWTSTLVNVGAGLGMMYYGKKAEEAANEYNAQAGWPSTQSYGYPFYQAGMSGVINGLSGPGAYGCAGTIGGGGFPNGAGGGWNVGGSANGAYGPFAANGGAFGYPSNMYGSPWGGGAYTPGFGPGGQMNGPFGGINVGGQFGFPNNGNFQMGGPQMNGQFGMPPFGGGPQMNGQFGMPPFGGGPQMNGGLSSQYQMQMMQQQQQMQMQYYQQQQQYYQVQMQQQQQQMQQHYQRQQQSAQIQMQIQQLTMQLQMLQTQYSGGGGGASLGGGFSFGVGIGAPAPGGFGGAGAMYPGGTPGFNPAGVGGSPFPGAGSALPPRSR